MQFNKKFLAVASLLYLNSCTFNVRLVEESKDVVSKETLQALKQHEGDLAIVSIAGSEYPCKLMSVDEDNLVLMNREMSSEIPIKAVSEITIKGSAATTGEQVAGFVIGGLTGGLVGTGLSKETTSHATGSGALKFQAASVMAGGILGVLVARSVGGGKSETYTVNSKIKSYTLDKKLGKSIPGLLATQTGLFKDLHLNAGEIGRAHV